MNVRSLLNWFLSPAFDSYAMSQHDIENVARMICNEGMRQEVTISCRDYEHICAPKLDIMIYNNSDFLRPVSEICNVLRDESSKHIVHFLLHGSLADLKYIKGWSDLDTWVVIDNMVFSNPLELMKLRNLFSKLNKSLLKIDSIAHHGFIIVLESDLEDYKDSLMPIEVIKTAFNLYGKSDIYIRKSDATVDWVSKFLGIKNTLVEFESSGVFRHHPYKGVYLTKNMVKADCGMYQLKYLIGLVISLPSLYYTAIGSPCYKEKAFEPFLKAFPGSSSIVECFSAIRTEWGELEHYPYTPNHIPRWLANRLPSDYVPRAIQLLDDILNKVRI